MKNGDLPAMPLTGDAYIDINSNAYQKGQVTIDGFGLTKREQLAAMAMQGLLVNAGRNGLEFHNAAEEAVRQADSLLKQLKKTGE